GVALVNGMIRTRMLAEDSPTTASFELERVGGEPFYEQRAALGQFDALGADNVYRGGEPNPFGMLLWYHLTRILSDAVGDVCESGSKNIVLNGAEYTLSDRFFSRVRSACTSSEDSVLGELWSAVLSFGLTGERTAFVNEFRPPSPRPLPEGEGARM